MRVAAFALLAVLFTLSARAEERPLENRYLLRCLSQCEGILKEDVKACGNMYDIEERVADFAGCVAESGGSHEACRAECLNTAPLSGTQGPKASD